MIRNVKEWRKFVFKRGSSGKMVHDIIADWEECEEASQELCELYFSIASDIIGEKAVRAKRDEKLAI